MGIIWGSETSISSTTDKKLNLSISAINSQIDDSVPSNAILDNIQVGMWVQKTSGIGSGDFQCYLSKSDDTNTAVKQLVSIQSDFINDSGNTMWADLTPYLVNGDVVISNADRVTFRATSTFSKSFKFKLGYSFDYHIPQYTLTVNASPTAGGTVTGGGTYDNAATATLTATAKTGYKFVKWSDGNTSASRTVTVTANATYTAIFEKLKYTLTVTAGTGGTVSGGGTYEHGATATLTATPNAGYKFVKWSDGNTSATRTVTVNGAATYTATFEVVNVYVSYNNLFSIEKWIDRGINNATQVEFGSIGKTIQVVNNKTSGEITTSVSYKMPVKAGDKMTADVQCYRVDGEEAQAELFVFFYTSETATDYGYSSLLNKSVTMEADGMRGKSIEIDFTVPDGITHIAIRVDNNTPGTTINFYDFSIVPQEYKFVNPYLYNADINAWSNIESYSTEMETAKSGYEFLGWFDSIEGGTQYTANSTFPTSDLVLYARWSDFLKNIYVGEKKGNEIYIGTTKVKEVYIGTTKVFG